MTNMPSIDDERITNSDYLDQTAPLGLHCLQNILNNTSNVTDRVFAIFSKLCKVFKRKFQGSEKNI